MKKQLGLFQRSGVVALLVSLYLCGCAEQPSRPDLAHVQVITYASGLTGFFDKQTGTLYIYDSNWNKCVFIRKVSKLGDPMQVILNPK